ncbi:MAG: sulfotransferase domain-containing protein [Chromatiales bacterium]|nr:sulfotransferase domain-containing protein [Chromatiales bacterium]MDX9767803.1 sulfotransferase domain-containing protein [Ectothiorhodospiraceae bacterium]
MIDFVIAGPPKSGTGSLYRWLCDHPDLQGSLPKEPFFLMDQSDPLIGNCPAPTVHEAGLGGYEAFFPEPRSGRLRFEATTHYYRQATARAVLSGMSSDLVIVFVLRKPSRRMLSAFLYAREELGKISPELDFTTYVNRLLDGNVQAIAPFVAADRRALLPHALEHGHYVEWLIRWRESVGDERLHLILFEAMIENPRRELCRLCSRLGIDETFYDDYSFPHHNRTILMKFRSLQHLGRLVAPAIPQVAKRQLRRWYVRIQERHPTSHETTAWTAALERLDAHFAPWNARLANEFGLDLDIWSNSPSRPEDKR